MLLIAHNAMTYNAPGTVYFADAARFKEKAIPLMALASKALSRNRIFRPTDTWPSALCELSRGEDGTRTGTAEGRAADAIAASGPSKTTVVWAKRGPGDYVPARIVDTHDLSPSARRLIPRRILQTATRKRRGRVLVQFFGVHKTYEMVETKAIFHSSNNVFADDYKLLLARKGRGRGTAASMRALRHAYEEALACLTEQH